MKLGGIAVALLALSACDQRAAPLAAYRHPIDAAASILPLNLFGVYSCASRRKIDGVDIIEGLPLDQCYKMQPARRFRGIWLDEFEGSTFFEGLSDIGRVKSEIRRRMKKPVAYGEWLGWNENRKTLSLVHRAVTRVLLPSISWGERQRILGDMATWACRTARLLSIALFPRNLSIEPARLTSKMN